jgi:signal transduction histidine kinase
MQVEVAVATDLGSLPAAPSATAYRLVQESLTNVRRHAGAGARVRLQVTADEQGLVLEVRSIGGAAAVGKPGKGALSAGGGMGLVAMRERVGLLGGTLEHGWASDGAFLVRGRIPLPVRHP